MAFHKQIFGQAPVGMWPSEGSVSQDIVAAIAESGVEWIGTDEEILSESTNGWISRDGQGHLRHPEMLYRPWRVESGDKSLSVIFRDHAMSDLVGFHYQRSDPDHAAGDLIGKLMAIGRAVEANNAGRAALVPVILDGENCWEYYPDGGVRFLRSLYRGCVQHPQIRPQRVRDYLKEHPPTDRIGNLYAGSWISHNFAIWIGHHEDNTAWDLLHQTREMLKQTEADGKVPARPSPRLGKNCSSPRGVTGSGGSERTIPRPRTVSSTSSSASTCKTSTRGSTSRRPTCSSIPIKRLAAPRAAHASHRFLSGESGRTADLFRMDLCRTLRLRQRARHDDQSDAGRHAGSVSSVSTLSGWQFGSTRSDTLEKISRSWTRFACDLSNRRRSRFGSRA